MEILILNTILKFSKTKNEIKKNPKVSKIPKKCQKRPYIKKSKKRDSPEEEILIQNTIFNDQKLN